MGFWTFGRDYCLGELVSFYIDIISFRTGANWNFTDYSNRRYGALAQYPSQKGLVSSVQLRRRPAGLYPSFKFLKKACIVHRHHRKSSEQNASLGNEREKGLNISKGGWVHQSAQKWMEDVVEKSDYHWATEPYSVALQECIIFYCIRNGGHCKIYCTLFFQIVTLRWV